MERKTLLDIQFLLANARLGSFSSFDDMLYSEVIFVYESLKEYNKMKEESYNQNNG